MNGRSSFLALRRHRALGESSTRRAMRKPEAVEEECECWLAMRVVDFGDGFVEPGALRHVVPAE